MSATVRIYPTEARVTVLCPLGHVIEEVDMRERGFAGSQASAEVGGNHARWNSMAVACRGHGH